MMCFFTCESQLIIKLEIPIFCQYFLQTQPLAKQIEVKQKTKLRIFCAKYSWEARLLYRV